MAQIISTSAERLQKNIGNRLTVRFGSLIVCGILLISVFFRCWHLDMIPGVNGDEAWLGWKAFEVAHGGHLDWRTNSGNFTDPFYILPLIALHKLLSPSAVLLRSVALVSGILMLPVNFFLCRLVFEQRTAMASTLILAVLPVNIFYSRFGWEPSQSVLFAVPMLYATLIFCSGRVSLPIGSLIVCGSLLMAMVVHPTNFFLSGFCVPAFSALLTRPESGSRKRLAAFISLSVLGCLVFVIIALICVPPDLREEMMGRLLALTWLGDGKDFLIAWIRMFNGINSMVTLMGAWPMATEVLFKPKHPHIYWIDLAGWMIFASALLSLWIGIERQSVRSSSGRKDVLAFFARQDIVLMVGFLLTSLMFDLLNGPGKVACWNDRYGLWAVPAGALILSRGAVRMGELFPSRCRLLKCCGVLLCALLLMEAWQGYFGIALSTGGNTSLESRVSVREIKLQAAQQLITAVSKQVGATKTTHPVLVSSDWFVYWPIVYFLRRGVGWKQWETVLEKLYPQYGDQRGWDLAQAVGEGSVAFADFSNSYAWGVWDEVILKAGVAYSTTILRDRSGHDVLTLKVPTKWLAQADRGSLKAGNWQ